MEAMTTEFMGRVKSIFVYTREAHPGELHGHHEDFGQKRSAAREMVERFDIRRQMLVDDYEGTAHRAYGRLPNMTYIVSRGGRVDYRASWTDGRTIRFALETLTLARAAAKEGRRVLPYFMEWRPTRLNDGRGFLEGLVTIGGERAANEYIEEAARAFGEAHVKEYRRHLVEYLENKS